MINGTPSRFFRSTKGLSQGDPLSLSFCDSMHAFSHMIEKAVKGGT